MQVTPLPWAGSCPGDLLPPCSIRCTNGVHLLCSPSPHFPTLQPSPRLILHNLGRDRALFGYTVPAARALHLHRQQFPSTDRLPPQSLPEAVAVPARCEHPQHTALSRQKCSILSPRRFAPTCQMLQLPQGKPLKEIPADLHGILQVYMPCH